MKYLVSCLILFISFNCYSATELNEQDFSEQFTASLESFVKADEKFEYTNDSSLKSFFACKASKDAVAIASLLHSNQQYLYLFNIEFLNLLYTKLQLYKTYLKSSCII